MATIFTLLAVAAAEGFLAYVLVQFTRELRESRLLRTAPSVVRVAHLPGSEREDRERRKVIDISVGARMPRKAARGRVHWTPEKASWETKGAGK